MRITLKGKQLDGFNAAVKAGDNGEAFAAIQEACSAKSETAPIIPDGYISGLGRSYPYPKLSHLYKGVFSDPGLPMCRKGWNRDDGESYSIFRGIVGEDGVCKVCLRRARKGLDGVESR